MADAPIPDEPKTSLVTPEELAARAAAAPPPIGKIESIPDTPPAFEDLIPVEKLVSLHVAPVSRQDKALSLGVTGETNITDLSSLRQQYKDLELSFGEISQDDFNLIYNRIYLKAFGEALGGNYASFGQAVDSAQPQRAFTLIAELAFLMGSSDIHIEPQAGETRVRFRIDGVLHPIINVKTESYKVFLSDLQSKAGLKWGSNEPQSGRITYTVVESDGHTRELNMRIETIPAFHGEEIVVRIFNQDPELLKLDRMGYNDEQIKTLNQQVTHFAGLVLVTGPTGSGKTSALYALVNQLNSPERKVVTLEDPVEYDLAGISQLPVKTEENESFADKLRAVLREDPNVIMVGEIRDADTARSALQAALTGHLVLSTFHANDTSSAIARLEDMIGENPLLASAIKLIMAQRLLRRVCPHCKESFKPTEADLEYITQHLSSLSEKQRPKLTGLKMWRGKGCAECHGIGYSGRVAVAEQLVVTPELQALMGGGLEAVAQKVREASIKGGMVTLLQDGLSKVVIGVTTLEEVKANLED